MKIVNLMENTQGDPGCIFQHGLSFYVETKKHKILVDAGPNGDILENAKALKVDLKKVDAMILSHGHYDHGGGILPFSELNPKAKIYLQQLALKDYCAYDGAELGYRYIGIDPRIAWLPNVVKLEGDFEIDEELSLFVMDQNQYPIPSTNRKILERFHGSYVRDEFRHEQALLIRSGKKSVVLSGCAHNGILNVMDTVVRKFGIEPDRITCRKSCRRSMTLRVSFRNIRKRRFTPVIARDCPRLRGCKRSLGQMRRPASRRAGSSTCTAVRRSRSKGP